MFAVDQFSIVCRKCMRFCSGFDLLLSVIAVQKICATSQLISCKTKTNHDLIGRVSAFWAVCFFFLPLLLFVILSFCLLIILSLWLLWFWFHDIQSISAAYIEDYTPMDNRNYFMMHLVVSL